MIKFFPLILVLALLVSSCKKITPQSEIDDQVIQNFLTAKKWMATKDPSGLYYIMNALGTGASPTSTSTVEVKYTGYLVDGTIFDQTLGDKTFSYALNALIPGWQIGIPLMKKGGKITLLIPSALGYGSYTTGPIPANSVLIFDIELIDVK